LPLSVLVRNALDLCAERCHFELHHFHFDNVELQENDANADANSNSETNGDDCSNAHTRARGNVLSLASGLSNQFLEHELA
jgi:hypothetical protein